MRRHVILIDVINVEAFRNEFVDNLPSSWDCVVNETGLFYTLEYDMRFEDDVFEALQKAHCRFTFEQEETL